jgi:hypothetical protein
MEPEGDVAVWQFWNINSRTDALSFLENRDIFSDTLWDANLSVFS